MGLIQFYPLDVSVRLISQRPSFILHGRTVSGEKVSVIDQHYVPYFYVVPAEHDSTKLEEDLLKFRIKVNDEIYSVLKIEKKLMKVHEKETAVLKLYFNNPFGFSYIYDELIKRSDIRGIFEHDVPLITSYLFDKRLVPGVLTDVEGEVTNPNSNVAVIRADGLVQEGDELIKNPKILTFDIEAYSPKEKEANTDLDPILMISFYSEGFHRTITWKKFETERHIDFVENEFELLNRFKKIIEEVHPDFLVGYGSDIYSFPYIQKRADKYGIKLDLGIDKSIADIGKDETSIKGIVHVDLYKFISKILGSRLESDTYRLEEVSLELLGEGKSSVNMSKLAEAWDNNENLDSYCGYNMNDAILIHKLFVKILPSIFEFVKLTNMELFDVTRGSFLQYAEAFLIKEARFTNELIPPKPNKDDYDKRTAHSYQGGFALEPEQGIYNNIVVYDFKSLYPSIISVHNISPGTLRCRCCDAAVPGEEMHFCTKIQGFFPRILGNLIDRRQRILKILNDPSDKASEQTISLSARQESLKILADSLYGYFGFPYSRWYNLECARAVTSYGHHYINLVIDKAKEQGFDVLYADTDSIFIRLGHKKKEQADKFFEELNSTLPEKMNMEFEGFYPRGIFIASKTGKMMKKYALLSENGFLKIKGLESARRNFSVIAKETQEQVLYFILKERKLRKALQHVQSVIKDVKDNKIPMRKMIIYTQLARELSSYETIAPHVAVAQKMQKQGFNVAPGSIIRYVVAKGDGKIAEMSSLPNEVKEYDADYYVEHQIIPSVERIFEAAGVDFVKAMEEKEQSSLGEFI